MTAFPSPDLSSASSPFSRSASITGKELGSAGPDGRSGMEPTTSDLGFVSPAAATTGAESEGRVGRVEPVSTPALALMGVPADGVPAGTGCFGGDSSSSFCLTVFAPSSRSASFWGRDRSIVGEESKTGDAGGGAIGVAASGLDSGSRAPAAPMDGASEGAAGGVETVVVYLAPMAPFIGGLAGDGTAGAG